MTRSWQVVAWSVLAILLLPGALAAGPQGLDEWIDIDLDGADAREILRSFGQILEAEEIRIDPAITGEVSIRLDHVRVRTVLTALCESLGCTWSLEERVFRVVAVDAEETPPVGPDAPISLELEDAPARQVLESFGRILRAEVEIDEGVGGTVTVQLDSVPAHQALDQVCEMVGCRWELAGGPDGPVLRIEPR